MVLVRRKDKRRGNEAEEIAVASDSSIVANKGVKSLASARTGRFAADMRVQVGGYGRADKTWGVDHPWHTTHKDIFEDLSARDRLEEGFLAKQEEKKEPQGLSRAALKKKKAKMKKGGLTGSTAGSDVGSAAPTVEQKPEVVEVPAKKGKSKTKAVKATKENKPDETIADSEDKTPAETTEEPTSVNKNKKRKRVDRNKKKKQAKSARGGNDDSSDEESELDETVEIVAKSKKQKAAVQEAQPTEVVTTSAMDKKQKLADAATREAVAKQYESALGQEFTTASGLMIRDIKLGNGRVPAIGEQLTVRYRGRIDDKNGIVFGKGMLTTVYGTGSVIAGWEEGMSTMRTGGVRHLVVPPELGYGGVSKGPKLPANSTLFFEVELVRMGKHKRDKVAEDDVPLPSSFQRKRVKHTPFNGKDSNKGNGGDKDNKSSKRRRRKYSI